jgi:hypothetical protein
MTDAPCTTKATEYLIAFRRAVDAMAESLMEGAPLSAQRQKRMAAWTAAIGPARREALNLADALERLERVMWARTAPPPDPSDAQECRG